MQADINDVTTHLDIHFGVKNITDILFITLKIR